tara:strand:- start:660 stop:1244 length:585 start_codon:yes stop_codon:yes gene_type:complete
MFRIISALIFKIKGWKVKIDPKLIKNNKQFVLLGIPHTSNWDAVYFTGAVFLRKIKTHFLIKKEWMRFPFNLIFKPIGGIGVNNKSKNGAKSSIVIEEIVQLFNEKKELIIAIAPEGTRSFNPNWKTGFYQIALQSKVPIALGFLDYKNKIAGITDIFLPTGNLHADLIKISEYYSKFTGKNHDQYSGFQTQKN